jgi:hypothetical protein
MGLPGVRKKMYRPFALGEAVIVYANSIASVEFSNTADSCEGTTVKPGHLYSP